MNKPILFRKNAFDANYDEKFEYSYSGNQQFKVEMEIRNALSNTVAYNDIQSSFQLRYILPKESLNNGESYTAGIIIYDKDGVASPVSDKLFFNTFSTPDFHISNLNQHQIINSSSYELQIAYSQPEGDLLDTYYISLYDIGRNEIFKSNMLSPLKTMSYLMSGFVDEGKYFIKAFGVTVGGVLIETEFYEISVSYITPVQFSSVYLENIPSKASIKIKSNLILIDGESNPQPPIYINNETVDLTSENSWIKYEKGFNILKDFIIVIDCSHIKNAINFFVLKNVDTGDEISIQKRNGNLKDYNIEQTYFVLNNVNTNIKYRTTSNPIDKIEDEEKVRIIVRYSNNLFSISAERSA